MADKIKAIPEQKLKAFSIGTMGKRAYSKKELEEQRKKEEEKAAAHVFEEFVATFQDSPITSSSKVWVKAGTYDAGARKEDTKDKGKIYKPQSRIQQSSELMASTERAQFYAKLISDKKPERLGKKKQHTKSNLEAFKEELRQIQEEREERHKYKGAMRSPIETELDMFLRSGELGSFDNGDPTTTNLYLGNLNPKITEKQLMEIFGRFGPLASIKIMWPRSDEEKARGRNCGFVAYMSRKDGERALRNLNGKDISGYDMKLGWGKSVIIPPHPIYIPPSLLELSYPPPPSGLPFNAQPAPKDRDVLPKSAEELNEILSRSVVKVVIPTDRNLLMLIHRMVEFVVREGPMLEAMIMNREIHNPNYRFLFENQSPAHIYYRWKLYSITHGDSQKEWLTKEFRLFKNGSIWKPPVMNSYTTGMPEELICDEDGKESTKGSLSNAQRDRLEYIIRGITPERNRIGEAMVFCIEHSEASEEVVECITESLTNTSTAITKKIARLYLVSDILHNCSVKVNNASSYRKAFEVKLIEIMENVKLAYDKLEGRLQAEGCKLRVLRFLQSLDDSIYNKDYVIKLRTTFLGVKEEIKEQEPSMETNVDIDGDPLLDQVDTDEDLPMDGATLLKSAMKRFKSSMKSGDDSDIDGKEIDDADVVVPGNILSGNNSQSTLSSGFIMSKWETVDPEQVEAQAMTTSKWDMLGTDHSQDSSSLNENQDSNDYSDSRNITEERRNKLREIEVKAVQYQDELESGQRMLKSGWTLPQQVEHYRRKLLKKSEKEARREKGEKEPKSERKKEERREESSEEDAFYKEKPRKSKKRSPSSTSSKNRSRSRSPARKKAYRALTPPSPPHIRRHSPRVIKSKDPLSPISSTNSKYASPARSAKKRSSSPTPRKARRSPSPRRGSPSPRSRRDSSSPYRTRYRSPETKKHRHKHKY